MDKWYVLKKAKGTIDFLQLTLSSLECQSQSGKMQIFSRRI